MAMPKGLTPEQVEAWKEKQRKYHRDARAADPEAYRAMERARPRNGDEAYKAKKREAYWRDRDRTREKRRAAYWADREKFLTRNKAYSQANPHMIRANKLKTQYGMTLEEFDAMRTAQGGCCAICGDAFTKIPQVDHCHATGAVRELLCAGCNVGLGRFKDDPKRLASAIEYLHKHSKARLTLAAND